MGWSSMPTHSGNPFPMRFALIISVSLLLAAAARPLSGGRAADSLDLQGLVAPSRVVELGSAADGVLAEVNVEVGDMVSAGQLLARLDPEVAQANVAVARARAEAEAIQKQAQLELELRDKILAQHQTLFDEGILSEEVLREKSNDRERAFLSVLEAKEAHTLAQLQLTQAQAILARTKILAPLTGVVTKRHLSPGEVVTTAGQAPVVTLAQLDPLVVEVIAPFDLLNNLRIGMNAEVFTEYAPQQALLARIKSMDRVVDAASGTFSVRLELPNPEHKLPAGLRCSVRFAKR